MIEELKLSTEETEKYNAVRQHLVDSGLALVDAAILETIQTDAAIYALEKTRDNCLEYGQKFDWLFSYDNYFPPSIKLMWSGQAVAALNIAESIQIMIDLMEQS